MTQKGFCMKHKWKYTHVNPCAKSVSERLEGVGNRLVQQHNPSPGGTMPAGLLSSCQCCRKSTKCQTLCAERDFVRKTNTEQLHLSWHSTVIAHLDLQPGSLSGSSWRCLSSPCTRRWAASPCGRSDLWPSRSSTSAGEMKAKTTGRNPKYYISHMLWCNLAVPITRAAEKRVKRCSLPFWRKLYDIWAQQPNKYTPPFSAPSNLRK